MANISKFFPFISGFGPRSDNNFFPLQQKGAGGTWKKSERGVLCEITSNYLHFLATEISLLISASLSAVRATIAPRR